MVAPYSLHGFARAGKTNGHSFKWKDNVLCIFANFFMAISSHDEPRACYFSNSTRLRGNNRRKHRTNSRMTFSMSGFVGRTELATADVADTSETGSPPVRPCVRKNGRKLEFSLHMEPDLFETGAFSKFLALAGGLAAPRETGKRTSEDQVVLLNRQRCR